MWNGLKRAEHFQTILHAVNPSSELASIQAGEIWPTLGGPCHAPLYAAESRSQQHAPGLLRGILHMTFWIPLKMKADRQALLARQYIFLEKSIRSPHGAKLRYKVRTYKSRVLFSMFCLSDNFCFLFILIMKLMHIQHRKWKRKE